MHVKLLVPEIDKKKWSEDFINYMTDANLVDKNLEDICPGGNSPQLINKIKYHNSIPELDRFLAFCRYFVCPPDEFLSAIPKWVECEVDDISCFHVTGKIGDTYYITPSNKKNKPRKYKELTEEPDPKQFSTFKKYGTDYNQIEKVEENEGKILYRFPHVKWEETKVRINSLLEQYHLKDSAKLNCIFQYKSNESTRRLINGDQYWGLENIYKLSWIFNKPIEDFLVIEYHDVTHESVFDFETYQKYFKDISPIDVWKMAGDLCGKNFAFARFIRKFNNRYK